MAGANEDFYDFNAPQHYFDFKDRMNDEPDDSYFDCQDGSGPFKLETPQVAPRSSRPLRSSSRHNTGTPRRPVASVGTPKKPLGAVGTAKAEHITPGRIRNQRRDPVKVVTPKKPSAPVKMEGDAQRTEMEVDAPEQSENKENESQADDVPKSEEKGAKPKQKKSFSPSTGVRSSPRLVAIAKAMRRSNAARRSAGSGSRSTSSVEGANLSVVNKQKTQSKPHVPKVSGMKGLSQKDLLELEAIATFKQKMVSNKKKGESTVGGLRVAPTVPHEFNFATDTRLRRKNTVEPVIGSKAAPLRAPRHGPTRPQEFHFATDSRVKKQASIEEEGPVEFAQSLRSGPGAAEKEMPKHATIPQPFNLTETRKVPEGEVNKFVSMAELNMKFHTRTPQRFRTSKRFGGSEENLSQNNKKNRNGSGVTIPVTPNFATKTRFRQVNYLTREEMEQKAFEEEQKHKFKANPLNKKIFDAPSEGYHAERKTSTIPEPFNITKTKKEEAGPLGGNFKEMCNKLGCSTASIASIPWGGVPSKWDKTNTKLQPFSFDTRDKHKMQRKQEMIQKIIEDEKKLAEFHAHPMPTFEEGISGVPDKKPPTPTKLQPFHLRSDERGEVRKEQIQKGLEEEERLDKERRTFHAQSDAILHKQPFIPEKSKKALTDISGFTLNTEVRAEARTEFELHQKMKEDELLAAKREHEERKAAEEAAEVAKQRREAVHKANPVPNYKPMEIKPAPFPVTVPISPNFATKSRLRTRNGNAIASANSTMNLSSATFTTE